MSEVLRDLVVSLSLDGDNFSRNLTSINKQIQEAKSEFRRAASGVDNFEKSVSGTQSQLSGLQQKLALQQKAVKQYERALEAANKKLENAYNRQGKLTESLDVAKQKNADLKQQVTAATKQYERFSRELGESDSATLAAKANLDALSQEYADSSAEVKKLEGQLAANTKSLQNNADAVTKARINLNNAQGALRQTEQQIRTTTERLARMQSAWTKAGDTLTAFGKKCASVSASMEKLGKGMTATLTTPVLALGTAAIKASVEYESAFASVRKTVDATETEYGQLSDAVKKMSTEVATDATDIAEVMANAGQLGTLMRATNATELFSEAQQTATSAWKDNVALSSEAGKRYATTESKLKNLKNTAVLAAQRIGDDLNPTVQRLIDGASDLIEKFMSLDESQRLMMIKFAAIAAAAGPAILVFSKIVKGVGTVSTGIGKFALTVAKAGGGWKGFLSVLSKSPAAWIAVAAAVIAATVALADYVSGAKQAREALQGMEDTARQWKDTAAETFYGQSEGLSFFGLDSGSFTRETKSAREWLQGVLAVWTDGKKETNEIVREWTDAYKELTASTRSELEEMRETAQTAGYTSVADQLSGDIDKLDAMDAEISRLLKKRQNGYFSDKDKIRLQELIDAREAIEIKYHLSAADTDGFEQIGQKLQAEIARAQAAGKPDADVTVYENAVKAAAEGMGAINTQLAEQYDKEFAIIQLISDETERQQALDQLNAKYNSDRLAAAQQYAQTLASIIMPVWQQEDIQGAAADIDTLTQKLREYSAADESEKPGILEDINEITAAMDEGAVTEYIALLMQVQSLLDSGMTEAEVQSLFPELDFSGAMDQIAAIQTFLTDRKNLLPGLESMFSEAIPDEVLKIATDLDMTGAQARWDEFAQNPGAITTEAIISGYGQQEGVEPPKLETVITISGYDLTAYRQFLADNPIEVEGVLRLSEVYQNPEDALKAENVTFWQNGVEIPASLVPKELLTPDKVAVLDEDGTMHILITPKIEGTAESVSAAGEKLDASFVTTSVFGKTSQHDWGALNGLLGGSLIDWMHSFTAELKAFDNYKGSWVTLWGLLDNNTLNGIDKRLNEQFSADNIAGLQTFVSEMVTAIQNGAEVSEEDLQKLQTIVDFLSALELAGVGENITAGIGDAMTAAGWDADAESVAGNLEAALNAAFVIHSPSQRVRPIGENVTAGVGEGMADYDLSADAEALAEKVRAAIETALPADALTAFGNSAVEGLSGALTGYSMAATGSSVATNVKSAMSGSLNASTLRPVGVNAMAGLKAGILAGRSGVISAMRSVARDAVNAAKRELKIKSPSGVFRDEVGRMAMRGFGQGALLESKNQAKVIQNAARYLTGAAQGGIGGANSYDNRKTYNQNASTTIQVDKLVVRDEQDVRSLAIEIAGLTKRQQRGKGMRFA